MLKHLDLILSEPVLHIFDICTSYYIQLSMNVLRVPADVPRHLDDKVKFSLKGSIEIYHATSVLWKKVSVCPDCQRQGRVLRSYGEELIEDFKVVKG